MRYLTEGRLIVTQVHGATVKARCRGQGAVYALGHGPEGWWCTCPARGVCAHLVAVQAVTAPEVHREP